MLQYARLLRRAWTYVAPAEETKLVPYYWIGNRERYDSRAFMEDLASRLKNRIQLRRPGQLRGRRG